MPAVIPDLDAPIVPGVSAAGIIVGTHVDALLDSVKSGAIDQVGVYSGYRGLPL